MLLMGFNKYERLVSCQKLKIYINYQLMKAQKNVVITGSTRGIGYGLANSLLKLGCKVVISGRFQEAVVVSVDKLSKVYGEGRVYGYKCNVASSSEIEELWDKAIEYLGTVDVWINNAGVSPARDTFWNLSPEQISNVVNTNLTGAMFGSLATIRGMLKQGSGAIYNMEGLGSDGRTMKGVTLYGTTKAGFGYLTKSLAREIRETPLIVCGLRPGMVFTDIIKGAYKDNPERWESDRRMISILCNPLEQVTPWLAGRILSNKRNGIIISYPSRQQMFKRLLLFMFRKQKLLDSD